MMMGILNQLERDDFETAALLIVEYEVTEVTAGQVRIWDDYDLLFWLAQWGNVAAADWIDAATQASP